MKNRICLSLTMLFLLLQQQASAQRTYADNSVLSSGVWVKLGITQEGVYKIDATTLSNMGFPGSSINSSAIRLFGNGGSMLEERNAAPVIDDLMENAIEIVDGGDGVFNGNDYLLFYAAGPNRWLKDSANQRFIHQKNLYTDTAFYYLTVGGTGKRITTKNITGIANASVSSFNERSFYENDLVNLLSSGKEWYGEEFNNNVVGGTGKTFTVDWPGLILTQPVTFITSVACRSIGAASSFTIQLNGQALPTVNIPSVSGYFLDAYALNAGAQQQVMPTQPAINIGYGFQPGTSGAQGWLNWYELHGRRALALNGTAPLFFRDWASVAGGNNARFSITNASANTSVWELTDPFNPAKITTDLSGTVMGFVNDVSLLREYVAFDKSNVSTALNLGKIANQNLHHSTPADYIIVTHPSLLNEARRLAYFHEQHDGYKTVIATTDQLYNEFSGGVPDPSAIRNFVKMYYDKAGVNTSNRPRFLLLFGTGSYDYKNRVAGNINLVPAYETANALDPLVTHTSDDFFGLLDDADDINMVAPAGLLDIGIGRIPARNGDDAKIMVDKIIHYYDTASLGAWRNQAVFIADDKDGNLHLSDAESLVNTVSVTSGRMNKDKIYLDAYPLVSGNGGARYPAVNDAIVNEVFNGNLIVNYSGHGNYLRLAEEAVLSQAEVNSFNNPNKLPLFITASCDFAPYDDPAKHSLGSGLLMDNINGAIALMTTTRVVFAYSNRIMNDNYLRVALKPNADGRYPSLGEAVQLAKNITYQSFGDVFNNRKFTLLGDPAMRLAFPVYGLQLTRFNNQPITGKDSLQPLGAYQFTGIVTDASGNQINNFNGTVYPTVFDKVQQVQTLGNDPASPVTSFGVQNSILYKGRATVTNGAFQFSFILPKDINYQPGKGRISLYADNGLLDASGADTSFFIGGFANNSVDKTGPEIRAFLNDDKFLNGGLTNENPVLLLHLSDSSGISTSGSGIGHDITAVLDGNEKNVLVLNSFYTAELDSYQRGQVLYQLPMLAAGVHSIRIKAWDVANNSSETVLYFVVAKQEKLAVKNLMNYPNPFSAGTHFSFEHNQPNTRLSVEIAIYTQLGQLVKTIKESLFTAGTRNCDLYWNGEDENGRKLKKAIYIYNVKVMLGETVYQESRQLLLF